MTCLTNLSLNDILFVDRGLSELGNLIHLRSLDLGWTNIDDLEVSSFASLVNLELLYLQCNWLTGAAFHDLFGLTKLQTLNLSGNFDLTDDGILACARAFQALRYLIICYDGHGSDYPHITSAAWRHLSMYASPTLTHVDAVNMGLTPADELVLARFQGERRTVR